MQTHHPFIPLQLLQVSKKSCMMNKLLVTEIALGIKAPADDLAISIPFNIHLRPFMTEGVLVNREDCFRATPFVITDSIREGLFTGVADSWHGE